MDKTSNSSISLVGRFLNTLIGKIKRKSAQEVGNKIAHNVESYNRYVRDGKCNCGGSFKNKIIGSDGLFTTTSVIFSCKNCGEDYKKYSDKLYLTIELEEAGIKEIGNGYRYMFWRARYNFALFIVFMVGCIIFFEWMLSVV